MTNLTAETSIELILFDSIITLGEKSGYAFTILDPSFNIIYQNSAHQLLTGFSFDEINNKHFSTIIGNSKSTPYCIEIEESMHAGKMIEMTLVHKKRNAKSFSSKFKCIPFQIEQKTQLILVLLEDVTAQKIKESITRLEQQILHSLDQSMHFDQKLEQICYELNFVMEPHCFATIAWLQNDLLTLYADAQKENVTTCWIVQQDPRYAVYANLIFEKSFKLLAPVSDYELKQEHLDYAAAHNFDCAVAIPLKLSTGERKGAIILYFDELTRDTCPFHHYFEKIATLIEYLDSQEQNKSIPCIPAFLDANLQIPNRHGMKYFLNQQDQELQKMQLSVVLVSPTEYVNVIELYGRDAGELVLKEMINRISIKHGYNIVLVGRFSSSTLYVVLAGELDLSLLAKHFQEKMSAPFDINGRTIYMTVKTGIASQQNGDCIEETSRQAEIALSKARQKNGSHLGIYDQEYANQIEKDVILLNSLTEAINNNEIKVYFQPKVELHRSRIDSMEALARWISPTLGFISPADFIPVAEKNGLIRKIDQLIIEQVLVWMQQRQYEGKAIVPVSVNISAEHFYHPNFINQLMALVHKYYADPKYVIIEITETLGLEDIERAQRIINRLGLLGFTVSVDDFGIGYSSLSYLQKLQFRELKIDMSFVRRLDEGGTHAIVRAIIDIAKNLEMRVIAEGVETEEQVRMLKELGCDVAQGYLYYKPMPIDALDF